MSWAKFVVMTPKLGMHLCSTSFLVNKFTLEVKLNPLPFVTEPQDPGQKYGPVFLSLETSVLQYPGTERESDQGSAGTSTDHSSSSSAMATFISIMASKSASEIGLLRSIVEKPPELTLSAFFPKQMSSITCNAGRVTVLPVEK